MTDQELPVLPLEFKASRAEFHDSIWLNLMFVIVGLVVIFGTIGRIIPEGVKAPAAVTDWLDILFLPIMIALAIGVTRLKRAHHQRISAQTRLRLSDDGIEFRDHRTNCTVSWNDVQSVALDSEVIAEDDCPDAIVIRSKKANFRISARFFTEEEVGTAQRIIKQKCPAARDNKWFRG